MRLDAQYEASDEVTTLPDHKPATASKDASMESPGHLRAIGRHEAVLAHLVEMVVDAVIHVRKVAREVVAATAAVIHAAGEGSVGHIEWSSLRIPM